mgnify:CR=1 FL=1
MIGHCVVLPQGFRFVCLSIGFGSFGTDPVVRGTPPAAAAGRRPHTQHEGWADQGARESGIGRAAGTIVDHKDVKNK